MEEKWEKAYLNIFEHIGYIFYKRLRQSTEEHFNKPGLPDIKFTAFEHIKRKCEIYRKEWERYFIRIIMD